ncbi:hypothetical protein [Schinkia azotoformans]|uniref:hypothetical protein n=1 Tax=Schinkia azotoformans TaxID=1454 RepID=UPI002DBD0891|nr:hypothetical protein [Schinkia azotoformans]MEC1772837.1 hypothetical protein [Schinkia azotoformans]MED4367444.1 hypothetical protein [Schinkia azotoformans]
MKIIDLDLLVNDPIEFKIGGESYQVSTMPTTKFILEMALLEDKMKNSKKNEEQIGLLDEMVMKLFNQENEQVSKEFVSSKLSFTQKKKIMEVYREMMNDINSNPN